MVLGQVNEVATKRHAPKSDPKIGPQIVSKLNSGGCPVDAYWRTFWVHTSPLIFMANAASFPTTKFSKKFGRRRQRSVRTILQSVIDEASQLGVTGVARPSCMDASEVPTL